jgi:carbamoylphosphate synthase large subunit
MKQFALVSALFCLLTVLSASAADTNFAGTWELDKAKSEGLQQRQANAAQTLTVTQDAKTLNVETKITVEGGQDRPAQKATYNLDGTETTTEVDNPRMKGKSVLKAKWQDGNKILDTTSVFTGKQGDNDVTRTTTDHWELAEDGKVLKIARTSERANGKTDSKLVFNKK